MINDDYLKSFLKEHPPTGSTMIPVSSGDRQILELLDEYRALFIKKEVFRQKALKLNITLTELNYLAKNIGSKAAVLRAIEENNDEIQEREFKIDFLNKYGQLT